MTQQQNTTLGIWLMILTTLIFALQDGISRHLAGEYNAMMIVMIRYWFFACFVTAIAARSAGGLAKVVRTPLAVMQIGRGALLVIEITVCVMAFVLMGLVETHAIFACYPLLIAALSGPVLGERVGWRRWVAIGIGFLGMMIILKPTGGVFSYYAFVPLLAALLFAIYGLLTRYVARTDGAMTSFFYTGIAGMVVSSAIGIWFWEPMAGSDWIWMTTLGVSGAVGHFTLIKTYEVAEASAVQPFAYFQLPFACALGVVAFGETIRWNVALGAAVIVGAGVFTLWRARLAQSG
jgi:drug/metabolite transporter (DMT)-like permease